MVMPAARSGRTDTRRTAEGWGFARGTEWSAPGIGRKDFGTVSGGPGSFDFFAAGPPPIFLQFAKNYFEQ